jgi:hypothetical protein
MDINLEPSERLRLAAELIRQSPPGQVNDVIAGEQETAHVICSRRILSNTDATIANVRTQTSKSSLTTIRIWRQQPPNN